MLALWTNLVMVSCPIGTCASPQAGRFGILEGFLACTGCNQRQENITAAVDAAKRRDLSGIKREAMKFLQSARQDVGRLTNRMGRAGPDIGRHWSRDGRRLPW